MSRALAIQELLEKIVDGKIRTAQELNREKNLVAKKYSLQTVPSSVEIISNSPPLERQKFRSILTKKPTRSMSGVNVVAVMTKPYGCVGKCIYCPVSLVPGKKTPKSYTGLEPSTMRGLMFNFNPYKIVENRLTQYSETNNEGSKIDLILQGGTFTALPYWHQKYFVKRCYDAVLGKTTPSLSDAKKLCEKSEKRVVGLTVETRPDWCGKKQINRMLSLGATRVEIGVQIPDDNVYRLINRGHLVSDVVSSTQLLKDSCFKICYHLMPGLYGSTFENDLEKFREIFSNPSFRPDMIKIYPALVIDKTVLHSLWKKGFFSPMSTEQAAKLVAKLKKFVPRYVRIMRVQRDIPSTVIAAGPKKTNLRQFVEFELKKSNSKCSCIRCREVGLTLLKGKIDLKMLEPSLERLDYDASGGKEIFLSFEDKKKDVLFGFCRLRIPDSPFRKEISKDTALIRELHVYSRSLPVGVAPSESDFQHRGFGKQLFLEAQKIAREEFREKKLLVISGIGVKDY
ncbi:MAG: tRNA uridine(34) 5-carboxymethylaminomethyl modification radical SAM/GNAT enzyme Elp3, partial [Candidatus Diapherotrites archaeon]|nr:tRNA uridine(34) 5-carboxymethylaminomethyl modification radical SAM/GNAT enzyme Elp3 [Candidatus Diapherotrites archaeon]